MKNLKIFAKLFLSHITVGIVSILSLAIIFYVLLRDNLIQRTLNQLSSINILKEEAVENYFLRSQQNLEALHLEHKFLNIYTSLTDPQGGAFSDNEDMRDLENISKLYNFKNIHLFDLQQHELFSTDSSLYSESLLQRIDSVVKKSPNQLHLIDASTISPRHETLLFYYVPILKGEQRVGTVIVEENFHKVQTIVLETTGMGTTGESYIVGSDYRLRSSSRFVPDKAPGFIYANTEAVKKSLMGLSGSDIITDYRGEKVLSVYRPIGNLDLKWVIVSEIDWTEAMAPINRLRYFLIGATFFILLLTTVITFFLSNVIASPIVRLREIIRFLSRGIIPEKNVRIDTTDEIGQMADSIDQLINGLQRTSKFAREIGSGNFNTSFATLSDRDTLGLSLLQMRDELKAFNEREIKMERARASALLEGQEKERTRIIQELHDGVGQLLTAIRMRVEMFEGEPQIKEEIKSQINETISEVRRISYNVMPQSLIDYGLEAALRGLCDSMKRYSNLKIDFAYVKEFEHTLNFEISTAIFRIAQEGLNNIIKHAKALQVNLHVIDKEDEIYLMLEDNGIGFNENKIPEGFGLQNIRERAKLLNGTALIESSPGEGTIIEVHIPIV
jgi:two-component system, NarL family, sensor kinase